MGDRLDALGYGEWERRHVGELADDERVQRVITEHRGAYEVSGDDGVFEAEVMDDLRRSADSAIDFPAVGDWVVCTTEPVHERRLGIVRIVPRRTEVLRRAPGPDAEAQVVGANIDLLGIVTTAGDDFNLRRLERYLAAAFASGAEPLFVLNKTDLADRSPALDELSRLTEVPIVSTSATAPDGVAPLRNLIVPGVTAALIGSSGVGKSSLVNRLMDDEIQSIAETRRDGRGRHTTVRRHLFVLDGGGVVIDTPGLREIQLWDDSGLGGAFPELADAAAGCRFSDCRHDAEPGCAVAEAVVSGAASADRADAYRALAAEVRALAEEREERRRSQRRRRDARRRH